MTKFLHWEEEITKKVYNNTMKSKTKRKVINMLLYHILAYTIHEQI